MYLKGMKIIFEDSKILVGKVWGRCTCAVKVCSHLASVPVNKVSRNLKTLAVNILGGHLHLASYSVSHGHHPCTARSISKPFDHKREIMVLNVTLTIAVGSWNDTWSGVPSDRESVRRDRCNSAESRAGPHMEQRRSLGIHPGNQVLKQNSGWNVIERVCFRRHRKSETFVRCLSSANVKALLNLLWTYSFSVSFSSCNRSLEHTLTTHHIKHLYVRLFQQYGHLW